MTITEYAIATLKRPNKIKTVDKTMFYCFVCDCFVACTEEGHEVFVVCCDLNQHTHCVDCLDGKK